MNLAEYTVPVEDGMRVRHDAQARFTVKTSSTLLEDGLTPIETLGGAMTLAGFMYNRATMSGGVSWWNPKTGRPIGRPKVTILVRPQDVLEGEQLCDCERCEVEP